MSQAFAPARARTAFLISGAIEFFQAFKCRGWKSVQRTRGAAGMRVSRGCLEFQSRVVRSVLAPVVACAPLLGCENPDRGGGVAARCAEVAHAYLGAPTAVEIVGEPIQHSEGEVEISYRTFDRENIPVEGKATCNFAVAVGSLQLISASVDGTELSGSETAAIRKSLGSSD
jgi:hypothetical protein